MRIRTGGKAVALFAALAMIAAACGGDDPVDEPEDSVEEPEDEGEDEAEEPADEGEDEGDAAPSGEGLTLGYILPETGQLAFLGPPMISGVELALSEINDAGGVLGSEVTLLSGDEAGDTGIAAEEASRLLAAGVDAIVGAAATGMTLAIIDQVTGAGVVQCSPSNTGPGLSDYPDGGFYFRTAPSDALQGPVLAEQVIADGYASVAIAARADDYGQGLLDATRDAFEAQGGTVEFSDTYDPEAGTFDSVVEQMVNSGAEAYVVISFAEGGAIVQGLLGAGADTTAMYGADGIAGAAFAEEVDPSDPNVLDGMTFTAPSSQSTSDFDAKMDAFNPELVDRLFSPQSYDCTNLIALSAAVAGTSDSAAIRDQMIAVTVGDNACGSFAECMEFVDAGESIAYQSAAGDALAFMEVREGSGEPSRGAYDVSRWVDGEFTLLEVKVGTVEQ
jgi:ABC-type branched-subunit amino acid transport system substrate-binding protein